MRQRVEEDRGDDEATRPGAAERHDESENHIGYSGLDHLSLISSPPPPPEQHTSSFEATKGGFDLSHLRRLHHQHSRRLHPLEHNP